MLCRAVWSNPFSTTPPRVDRHDALHGDVARERVVAQGGQVKVGRSRGVHAYLEDNDHKGDYIHRCERNDYFSIKGSVMVKFAVIRFSHYYISTY